MLVGATVAQVASAVLAAGAVSSAKAAKGVKNTLENTSKVPKIKEPFLRRFFIVFVSEIKYFDLTFPQLLSHKFE